MALAPREERDALAAELAEKLAAFREIVTGVHGRDAPGLLGLVGETPRDPVQLSRHAGMIAERLATSGKLPAPRVRGAKLDLAEWGADFADLRKRLDASLATVAKEVREAEGTILAKNRAIEAYDTTFSRVASLLSALLALAGDVELARRLRPSARRPGQVLDAEEPLPAPQPAPAAGSASTARP